MIYYLFDGSVDGLMCCLYRSFTKKEMPDIVSSSPIQLCFDCEITHIETDPAIAERVRNGIVKNASITLLNRISYIFRSCDPTMENTVFCVAHRCLKERADVSLDFSDVNVLMFSQLQQKINYEIHRFTGFLRFSKSVSGYYYAHFEPDNDIVDLVAKHFFKRFPDPFFIHDVSRNKATARYGQKMATAKLEAPVTVELDQSEEYFEQLFKAYCDSVNIKERKNLKLMRSFAPQRYYKHMPEKMPDKFFN